MASLLNVDNALEQILDKIHVVAPQRVALLESHQHLLAEDIVATQNLPAFANSSMDGYALIADDSQSASQTNPVSLKVTMDIPAGSNPIHAIHHGEAARIMTGAPIPQGANAVIPVEDTDSEWMNDPQAPLPSHVALYRSATEGASIRQVGENIREGQTVLRANTVVGAPEMALLASLGYAEVLVYPKPTVVILTSGDELVDLTLPLTRGKIRDTNSPALSALVRENYGHAILVPPAKDTLEDVRRMFTEALAHKPDLIISTAGVSVGAADLTRLVLAEMGEVGFWRINFRPGKPLAFGNIHGIPFFGLPGNPVSAMVTFDILVRPALLKLANRPDEADYIEAKVTAPMTSDGRRSYIRVQLTKRENQWFANETGTQSSDAIMSLVMADGLLIIPEDMKTVERGTTLTVKLLRAIR